MNAEPISEKSGQIEGIYRAIVIKVGAAAAIGLVAILAAPVFGQERIVEKIYIAITIEIYGV